MSIAVIKTGGKQYKVKAGDVLEVEKLDSKNKTQEFPDILNGKVVKAEILAETKGEKVRIFKFKNKTGYKKTQGHRQKYSQIKIKEISG
jgi:large subunit ribosomal protein L21